MNKEQNWKDYGNQKISVLNHDADILLLKPTYKEKEVEKYPNLKTSIDYIAIKQQGFEEDVEKPYHMECGTIDLSDYDKHMDAKNKSTKELMQIAASHAYTKGLPDNREHYDLNLNEILLTLDSRGVDVRESVEKKEDLGDYYGSSVIAHKQTLDEKKMVLESIRDMKPGDELTFCITDPEVYKFASPKKHHMVCVEKDTLRDFDIVNIVQKNMTRPQLNTSLHEHSAEQLGKNDAITLFDHTTFSTNVIPIDQVEDIKINRNHFTKEECEKLQKGTPIDYNKVMVRHEIARPKEYMEYVLRSQNKKERTAYGDELTQEASEQYTNAEYRKIYGEVHETITMVKTENNKELLPAIKTLRDASLHVIHDGLEGQKMATTLDSVANGLARGRGLDLACTMAEKEHSLQGKYVDMIKEQLRSRYPELDKGLEKLIEKREEKFYLKENKKTTAKVRAKGIHRKSQGKDLGR